MFKYPFLLLLLVLAGMAPARAQVAVIAHPGVADAAVSTGTLVGIYSLERTRWSDGRAIVPFNTDTAVQGAFYSALGQSTIQFKNIWLRKKLSGEGQPPESLRSEAEVVRRVASTPGAVGFVSASAVNSGVKVIASF